MKVRRVIAGYYEVTSTNGRRWIVSQMDSEETKHYVGWWRLKTADEDFNPLEWADDYRTLRDALASIDEEAA